MPNDPSGGKPQRPLPATAASYADAGDPGDPLGRTLYFAAYGLVVAGGVIVAGLVAMVKAAAHE